MKHKVGDIVKINGHEFEVERALDKDNGAFRCAEYQVRMKDGHYRCWIPAHVVDHIADSVTQDNMKVLCEKIQELARNQEPLGEEFAKVLHDNLWELYDDKTD
jgi:hypothetical protein